MKQEVFKIYDNVQMTQQEFTELHVKIARAIKALDNALRYGKDMESSTAVGVDYAIDLLNEYKAMREELK